MKYFQLPIHKNILIKQSLVICTNALFSLGIVCSQNQFSKDIILCTENSVYNDDN